VTRLFLLLLGHACGGTETREKSRSEGDRDDYSLFYVCFVFGYWSGATENATGAELPDGCVPTSVTPKGMQIGDAETLRRNEAFTKNDASFSRTRAIYLRLQALHEQEN